MRTKSIWKALLGAILMCCLVFALAACAGKYTVTFNYGYDGDGDGTMDTKTVEVTEGGLVTAPETPTRDGYTFAGWYLGNEEWNFAEDTVTEDITLEAKWSEGGAIDPGTPSTEAYLNYSAGELTEVSVPERQKVTVGQTVKLPAALEADGYVFMGWLVQGETEPRAAGSDYTVTGTVTITAQWAVGVKIEPTWSTDGVFNMTGENEFVVYKDLVGTYQPTEGEPVTVTITKAELEAALEVFEGTIEQGHPQTTPTAGAFHATSEEATCTEAGEDTIQYTVYYVVPGTNYYVSESVVLYSKALPADGHNISWSYDADTIADDLMQGPVEVSGTCSSCHGTFTETLPQIVQHETNGNFWFADEYDWGALDDYLPKKAEADIVAGEYYITGYTAPECESEGNISGYYLSATYGKISFGGCSLSATGHDYPSVATYADGVWKVVCGNGCGTSYSMSVTFEKGDEAATGDAPSIGEVSFNSQALTFSFSAPECTFEKTDYAFKEWTDGEETYTAESTVTVPADGSVTLTATWILSHTHEYTFVEEVPATCISAGTKAHYVCKVNDCGKLFVKNGEDYTEVTAGDLIIPATGDHTYGEPAFVTEGTNAGKFVATCQTDGCGHSEVVAAFDSMTVSGPASYALDETPAADDFTVSVVYKYQIGWNDASVGDVYLTITPATSGYESYFENTLSSVSTATWQNGVTVTFTFKVNGTKVGEAIATFEVVPTATQLGIDSASVLVNKAGDASNRQIEASDLANVDTTGVSVTFWLGEALTASNADWSSAVINNSGLIVTLPNLDPWNNTAAGAEALKSANKIPVAGTNLTGGWIYSVFLGNTSLVTISLNADGSINYYKNGTKVITYGAAEAVGSGTVETFTDVLLSAMTTSGFLFAGGVTAENLLVTTALGDADAAAIYSWYASEYLTAQTAADTALESDVSSAVSGATVYAVQSGDASGAVLPSADMTDVASKGVSVTYYIPAGGVAGNDWALGLQSGAYAVTQGILDAFTSTGDLAGGRIYCASATQSDTYTGNPDEPWTLYSAGNCYVTITVNAGGSVEFYKDGNLELTFESAMNLEGTTATKTVADFVATFLSNVASSGMQVGGRASTETSTWIQDLVVTSALSGEQVTALNNALKA